MLEAKKRDRALILVKRRFTEITVQQTKQFMTEVRTGEAGQAGGLSC